MCACACIFLCVCVCESSHMSRWFNYSGCIKSSFPQPSLSACLMENTDEYCILTTNRVCVWRKVRDRAHETERTGGERFMQSHWEKEWWRWIEMWICLLWISKLRVGIKELGWKSNEGKSKSGFNRNHHRVALWASSLFRLFLKRFRSEACKNLSHAFVNCLICEFHMWNSSSKK